MALSYPPQFLLCAAAYTLEGVSRPHRPMVVNLAMLPINAALAWAWAGGHWGFPAQGAADAALATACTSVFGEVAMIAADWTLPGDVAMGLLALSLSACGCDWRGTAGLVRFGLDPAVAARLDLVHLTPGERSCGHT